MKNKLYVFIIGNVSTSSDAAEHRRSGAKQHNMAAVLWRAREAHAARGIQESRSPAGALISVDCSKVTTPHPSLAIDIEL